jgi:MSHA biogenesis protein MshQ
VNICNFKFLVFLMAIFASVSSQAVITTGNSTTATDTPITVINTIAYLGVGNRSEITGCGNLNPVVPAPGGAAVDDLLIASIAMSEDNGTTVATPTDWTLYDTSSYAGQNLKAFIFYKFAVGTTAGADAVTFVSSTTGSNCSSTGARVARFSNVDSTNLFFPVAGAANFTQSNSGNITTGTIDTSGIEANTMVLISTYVNDNRRVSEGDGFSQSFDDRRNVTRDYGHGLFYRLETTTGNKNVSNWDLSGGGSDENIDAIYALRPSTTTTIPTSLTIAVPAGTSNGDVMVAAIGWRQDAAITATVPAGWVAQTAVTEATGIPNVQQLYYKIVTGAEPANYTWTFSGNLTGVAGGIINFTGVDTSNVVNVIGGNGTGATGQINFTANSVNTTVADTMIISAHSFSSSQTMSTPNPPVGMMSPVNVSSLGVPNGDGISLSMHYVTQAAAAATGAITSSVIESGGIADSGVSHIIALTPISLPVATVTTATTGGAAISADTAPAGSGVYTVLTDPIIEETSTGGMAIGSYTLTAPTGFEFDTGTNVTIGIGTASGSGTDLTLTSTSVTPTSGVINFNVTGLSGASKFNSLTFSGIRVRPTVSCALATFGNIVFATATATTITDSNAGTLAEVVGTATSMYTVLPGQTTYDNNSCGTVSGTATDQVENIAFDIAQLVVTDQFGNIQTDYDNAGVTITYVYTGLGTPVFTSPVSFTDGVATTTLTSTLDTADTGVTITADDGSLTGVVSAAFDVTTIPPITGLIAEYQMEESNWDGTPDEVIDSSGNDLHGVSINGPDTSNAIPAIAGDPGTCNYGVFDQIDDLASVADDNLLDIENSLTVTTWIYTFSHPGADLKTILSKDTNYEFHLNTSGQIFWWWGGGARSLTSTTVIPLNEWHHIAIVYDGDGAGSGVGTIYIDGVAEATTAQDNVGTLFTNANPLEIAADQAFAGRNFDGWIDEVRIYESVLSAAQVGVVMNETQPCTNPPTLPVLNADWHVDGPDWIGTGDSIPDFSGNGYDGTTNTTANVIGLLCNAADLSANSATDYLSMNSNALNGQTDFSIALWVKTANTGNQTLISGANAGSTNELIMWLNNNTSIEPYLNGGSGGAIAIPDLTAVNSDIVVADNTWHHLVWTRNGSQNCIFVDTNSAGCSTIAAGAINIDAGGLIIGQEQDAVGGGFDAGQDLEGFVDEIMIFSGVLSVADIQTIYFNHLAGKNFDGSQRDCPVVQYNISHDGTGVSCLSESVTITAIDAHGDTTDPGNIKIDLSVVPIAGTVSNKGTWARINSGTGSLTNNATTDGTADYTFAGDGSSSVQLAFNYTALDSGNNTETINFNVDDPDSIMDTRDSNGTTDPDMVFSLTGFQFYNYDTSDEVIATQISGKPSNEAPNDDVIGLRAVRISPEDASVCEAAFPIGASITIPIGAECLNPSMCAGRQVQINSTPVNTNADNAGAAGTTSYSNVSLLFEDDGMASGMTRAPLIINYPDAGQIQLHARYEIPLDDGGSPPAGTGSGGFMEGSSQTFIVRPFGLAITDIAAGATSNPGTLTTAANVFTTAGSDFSVTVGAYLWQEADDDGVPWGTGDDGIPDFRSLGAPFLEGVDITDNNDLGFGALASNFDWDATIAATLYTPTGQTLGTLNNGTISQGDFSSGETIIADMQYTEVGSILLTVTSDDYLSDASVDILGASALNGQIGQFGVAHGGVGRFIPWRFEVISNTPDFADSCSGFTYQDQPFYYNTAPVLTLVAKAETLNTTMNYGGGNTTALNQFVRFLSSPTLGRSFLDGHPPTAPSATLFSLSGGTVTLGGETDYDGMVTLTLQNSTAGDSFAYEKAAEEDVFDADIDISFLAAGITDLDGVCYDNAAGRCNTTITPVDVGDDFAINTVGSSELRFGRLQIGAAAGSELLPLSVPFQTEYYDGDNFVLNTDDTCTSIAMIGLLLTSTEETAEADGNVEICAAGGTTIGTMTNSPLVGGDGGLSFSAPGELCTGYADITLDLGSGGLNMPWLLHDWDEDLSFDDNPTGRATFGVFSGQSEFIYIREPW